LGTSPLSLAAILLIAPIAASQEPESAQPGDSGQVAQVADSTPAEPAPQDTADADRPAQQADAPPPDSAPQTTSSAGERWARQVREFRQAKFQGTVEPDAGSRLLRSLSQELATTRDELAAALRERDLDTAIPVDAELVALFGARDSLLLALDDTTRQRIFALGRDGLREVKGELAFFWLHSRQAIMAARSTGSAVLVQWLNAPLGWIPGFLKILLASLIFLWWRRTGADALVRWRKRLIEMRPIRRQNVRLAKALWYLDRIRPPLEWLFLLAAIVSVTAARGFGPALFVWAVAKWVLIGWTAVLLVDAFAARSAAARRGQAGLRRRSLWLFCWWIVAFGLGRQLVRYFFGGGALFHWITAALLMLLGLAVLVLLIWWRDEVPERLDALSARPRFIDALLARRTGLQSYATSLIGGAYLLFDGVRRAFVRVLANSDLGRRTLAHLTRSEIARQALHEKAAIQGAPISEAIRGKLLDPHAPLVEKVVRNTVASLIDLLGDHTGTVAALIGERGSGKTRVMERLVEKIDQSAVLVSCPFGTFDDLAAELAAALLPGAGTDGGDPGALIRASGHEVIVLEDVHRLARPVVGGRSEFAQLRALVRDAGPDVSWVFTIDSTAWEYLRRFKEEEPLHHHILRLEPWEEDDIARLVGSRCEWAAIDPDYTRLILPRQLDDGSYDGLAGRNRAGFLRILWDDSGGNPEAALRLFAESLVMADSDRPIVRLAHPPVAADLEGLEPGAFFVLRTLLRLEKATPDAIAACLPMSMEQVEDTLLFARSKGILHDHGDCLSVDWRWDRAVRRALARRNMTA
jgi:hypothetical protein